MGVPLTAVIADDAGLWRDGVAGLLRGAGIDVVAAVGDAEAFTEAVDRERPAVAIVDVRMPPTLTDDGLRAAIWVRRSIPGVAVLVLCQHVHSGAPLDLLVHGGDGGVGYLLKERVADATELISTVRRVAAGETVIDPLVAERLMARRGGPGDPLDDLSAREREVLKLMAEGRSNQSIAEAIVVTLKTVEAHTRTVMLKLGLNEAEGANRRVLAVLQYLRAVGDEAVVDPSST